MPARRRKRVETPKGILEKTQTNGSDSKIQAVPDLTSSPNPKTFLLVVGFFLLYTVGLLCLCRTVHENSLLSSRKIVEPEPPVIEEEAIHKKAPPLVQLWRSTKHLVAKVVKKDKKMKQKKQAKSAVSIKSYPSAYTDQPRVTAEDEQLLREFAKRVHDNLGDTMSQRVTAVGWGGQVPWWDTPVRSQDDVLATLDGGHLLAAYYRIMHSHMKDPKDLSTGVHFPFRLCKESCGAEQSIAHTLEWREKYRPWQVSPSVLEENQHGWIYTRGLARPGPGSDYGRHAMIWARPGAHKVRDPLAFIRCIMQATDQAVGDGLAASNGRVGKFNVVVDASQYKWGNLPALSYLKQAVAMFQDHFPDRLGIVLMVNLSRTAEILVNLIKALLTKEVSAKIHVLSSDKDKMLSQLGAIVEEDYVPDWLGGPDTFRFDAAAYYPKKHHISDKAAVEYIKTMPYHAA